MNAYVLVQLAESQEREVLQEFLDLSEVDEAHILFGEWDLILKIHAINAEDVADFVIEKVRKNPAVSLTSTLIVAK